MSFWDDIKKFAQPYDEEDDYDDYDDEDMDDGYEEEPAPRFSSRRESTPVTEDAFAAAASTSSSTPFSSVSSNTTAAPTSGFSGTVINTGASNKQQVILTRPETFNDAPAIANNLRAKKAIVLNLEGVDKALARRVVDFLSGCAYSLDGSVKKISQATYLFCPYNMEVLGDLKSLQAEVESYI